MVVRRWWPSFSHDSHDDDLIGDPELVEIEGIPAAKSASLESSRQVDIAGDTGGRGLLDMTIAAIDAGATTATISVDPHEIARRGTYEVALPLDPAAEKSPTLTVKVIAGDHWIWPLIALLCGAGLAYWLFSVREMLRPKRVLQLALTRARPATRPTAPPSRRRD